MSESDPKRMLEAFGGEDGASSDLARLLRAGKSEVPTDAQVMALAAKIGVIGGLGGAGAAGLGGGGGAGAGAGAKAAVVGTTAAKAGLGGGLAVKIGGAVVVATAATASVAVVATKHHTDVSPQPSIGLVAPSVVVTAPVKSTGGATATAQATAILPLEEDPAPSASPSSSHKVAHVPASAEGPEAEVRLLERAQDALRSRPAEALALADDHARRFPSGMLAQEREVIAIEALVKLGRTADAKARATRFKSRFPGSSHTRRIDTLVGE